jgi:hypothetical protein
MKMSDYKQAMKDIAVNPGLIQDTARKMDAIVSKSRRLHSPVIRRLALASGLAAAMVAIMAAVMLDALPLPGMRPDASMNGTAFPNPPADPNYATAAPDPRAADRPETLAPIARHYVPVQPSGVFSNKLKAPRFPFTYEELKRESPIIVLGTVRDAGVYSNKEHPLDPERSLNLATYLYTVRIDQVLSGSLPETEGSEVAVGETAVAHHISGDPDDQEQPVWRFEPYTARPEAAQTVEPGKTYVLFLAGKDDTDVYRLSWNGFGVFPLDYIAEEAAAHTPGELREQYRHVEEVTRAPMENDLLYRLCGLYVMEEFLNASGDIGWK